MKKIEEILLEIKPTLEKDKNGKLILQDSLDSFDIIKLISMLEENFDIDIPVDKIIPQNFDTVNNIKKMLNELLQK